MVIDAVAVVAIAEAAVVEMEAVLETVAVVVVVVVVTSPPPVVVVLAALAGALVVVAEALHAEMCWRSLTVTAVIGQ